MQASSGGRDMAAPDAMAGGETNEMSVRKPGPPLPQQIYLAEAQARYQAALDADIGLVERLTWFWSNHFCVSADKGLVRSLCGAYEREAIRPHVLGTLRRHADRGRDASGDAHLSRQCALVRSRLHRRPTPAQGAQREPRARDHGIAYARRTHRLHAGRRHQFRQGDHRLERLPAAPVSRTRRRILVQRAHARAGRADGARQELRRRRLRARPRRAGNAGASSGHGEAHRHQARPAFRRRRAAGRSRRAPRQTLPRHRRRSDAGDAGAGHGAGAHGRRRAQN